MRSRDHRGQRGQVLVLVAISLVALIAATGMIVDVGFAWSQQRATQNSADAAARAGAAVLAQKAAEGSSSTLSVGAWDEAVRNAVYGSGARNSTTIVDAEYTDWLGNLLGEKVGGGSIPADAAGVHTSGQRTPATYLVRIVGINNWTITQAATAVSGPSTGCIETSEAGCTLLPVTFPVTVYQCTNNGKTLPINPPQTWDAGQMLVLPLCGGNPGSVGWIDWTPPNGGTSEVVDEVNNPPAVSIPLPSWQYITQTGGISASGLENALNQYAGQIVQVPMFDSTCNVTPTNNLTSGCPVPPGGNGVNQWYHIAKFLSFRLATPQGAFINGNNTAVCGTNATQCLVGSFVSFITSGTVGPPCGVSECPPGTTFAVQLIK